MYLKFLHLFLEYWFTWCILNLLGIRIYYIPRIIRILCLCDKKDLIFFALEILEKF